MLRLVILAALLISVALAEEQPEPPVLGTAQIVASMIAMNQQRAEALSGYTATRVYHLEYHGLKNKSADVVVKMTYHSPDQKEFTIVSETGSKMLRERVLRRLLESEVEAMRKDNRLQTAITPNNYDFELVGRERTPERELYVLTATPKAKNKFLFKGRIWVDAQDFAIVRIEGEPAKNPSWWTKRNDFRHSYHKWGNFWLPERNETVTQLRLLGRALLTIDYMNYDFSPAQNSNTPQEPPVELSRAAAVREMK